MLPLGVVQTGDLNEFEIRSLDGELEALCASMDDVFARPASRENLRAMVRGLLSEVPRKNLWQLAEFAGHPNPDRLQGFLAKAAWDADELRDRVRAYAVAALAAGDAVLIADETGDIKKGTKTAGVQRQYTGTAGRIKNAQVSVHLSYVSNRGRTLIDRELYLGRAWAGTTAEHEHRCAEQDIPPERATEVATKPELARRILERALEADVPFTYFLADEAYGQCRALRAWLEERRVRYVLAIPKNEAVPLPDSRTRQARELYALVPEGTFHAAGIVLLDQVTEHTGGTVRKALVDQGFKNQVVAHGASLGIDVEVVARDPRDKGFVPQPKRWRVEQTSAGGSPPSPPRRSPILPA
jgi:hypothetical protein